MKIRDPKTGQTWDKLSEAFVANCAGRTCEECCFGLFDAKDDDEYDYINPCVKYVMDNPKSALSMMGCAIVYDRPRLCEVLGVDVGEKFSISGLNGVYTVDRLGQLFRDSHHAKAVELSYAINQPDWVKRLPRWTADDIADAKAIKRIYPWCVTVKRDVKLSTLYYQAEDVMEQGGHICDAEHILKSLRPGEEARLEDIISCQGNLDKSGGETK